MPQPYVGEPVHYVVGPETGYTTVCRASLVTYVWPLDPSNVPPAGTVVDLVVFDRGSTYHLSGVWADPGKVAGTWHEINDFPDYSGG